MDILQMLAELRSEIQRLEEAIVALQRLATGGGKRRGRPPKWMAAVQRESTSQGPRRKRVVSPEARAKMAAAQKRRWEKYRKSQQ